MNYSALIIIIEPNSIYRAGLLQVIQGGGFANCIAIDSVSAIRPTVSAGFDELLFLADLGSDEGSILAGMEFINHTCLSARIVLVSDTLSERQLAIALQAGADGLVLKFVAPEVLTKSIELVLLGQPVFPLQVFDAMRGRRPASPADSAKLRNALGRLSPREAEVLKSMCLGNTNKMIARLAGISEATVKVHVKAILRKLGARNRTEAALWASPHCLGEEPASGRLADRARTEGSALALL